MVPYTGTLSARVEELSAGDATVTLQDRRGIRNHLGSIHAIALANLGEVTSGLAMLTSLPAGVRGIVTRFEVVYLKKARGRLTARSVAPSFPVTETADLAVEAEIADAGGNVVARARATWRVSPRTTA
jgi:acyl-coenzyme A thioesterase PaaI-like protein